jgi:hypothetical protein
VLALAPATATSGTIRTLRSPTNCIYASGERRGGSLSGGSLVAVKKEMAKQWHNEIGAPASGMRIRLANKS